MYVRTVWLCSDGVIDEKGVKTMTRKYSARPKKQRNEKLFSMLIVFHLSLPSPETPTNSTRHSRSLLEPEETIRERHHTQITRVILSFLI
mmetsp:Transcript_10409/g.22214  ORF Transcript_10409/g.22214 Transcript_10409/m.22214 type:complete len:90 (-) Transcript_10409:608-877(-)